MTRGAHAEQTRPRSGSGSPKVGRDPLGRRWPIAPLLDATGMSARELAVAAGFTVRTGNRWALAGELDDCLADHLATRCDLHPSIVWPDWCAGDTSPSPQPSGPGAATTARART